MRIHKLPRKGYRLGAKTYLRWGLKHGYIGLLFIVAHMRSGSSLLLHILASNKEIVGYGETHESYTSWEECANNCYDIIRRSGCFIPRTYVLDKVLEEDLEVPTELMQAARTRTVFLVRKPEPALSSMLELGLEKIGTPQKATRYYCARLRTIKQQLQKIPISHARFLTYNSLVFDSSTVLTKLTEFLELEIQLQSDYETMWSTGMAGLGDPSETIEAGKIVRRKSDYDVQIPEHLLTRARAAYRQCIESCRSRSIGGLDSLQATSR